MRSRHFGGKRPVYARDNGLAWLLYMVTATLVASLFSCGVPVVPSPAQLQNYALQKKMQLLSEIVLTGVNTYLPQNTLGPEQDLVPFIVPQPEYQTSRGWIVFPSLTDTNGKSILSTNNGGSYSDNGAAWIFPVDLASGNAVHTIPFDTQISQASHASIPLEDITVIGSRFARLQTFPISEAAPPATGSRLAIVVPGYGNIDTVAPRLYLMPLEGFALSDSGGTVHLGTSGTPNKTPITFYDFSPAIVAGGTTSTTSTDYEENVASTLPSAIPALYIAAAPDRTGVLLITPGSTGTTIVAATTTTTIIAAGTTTTSTTTIPVSAQFFTPGPAATPAGANLLPGFSFGIPQPPNGIPFFTWNQGTQTALNWSFWDPGNNSGNIFARANITSPIPILQVSNSNYPVVRVLLDGTTLALQNQQWVKVNSEGSSTSSSPINTGSMTFVYEIKDSTGDWLLFSEAILSPGQNGNDLRLRSWRIKKTDLIQ